MKVGGGPVALDGRGGRQLRCRASLPRGQPQEWGSAPWLPGHWAFAAVIGQSVQHCKKVTAWSPAALIPGDISHYYFLLKNNPVLPPDPGP